MTGVEMIIERLEQVEAYSVVSAPLIFGTFLHCVCFQIWNEFSPLQYSWNKFSPLQYCVCFQMPGMIIGR